MSFFNGLFTGAQDTGSNIARAIMLKRQKEIEDQRRLQDREWKQQDTETAQRNLLDRMRFGHGYNMELQNDQQAFTGGENEKGRQFQLDLSGQNHTQNLAVIAQQNKYQLERMDKQFGHDSAQAKIAREWQMKLADAQRDFLGWQSNADREARRREGNLNRDMQKSFYNDNQAYRNQALGVQKQLGILSQLEKLLLMAGDDPAKQKQIQVFGTRLLTEGASSGAGGTDAELDDINKTLDAVFNRTSASAQVPSATPEATPAGRVIPSLFSRINPDASIGSYEEYAKRVDDLIDRGELKWDQRGQALQEGKRILNPSIENRFMEKLRQSAGWY